MTKIEAQHRFAATALQALLAHRLKLDPTYSGFGNVHDLVNLPKGDEKRAKVFTEIAILAWEAAEAMTQENLTTDWDTGESIYEDGRSTA